jgi:hypothetical protein
MTKSFHGPVVIILVLGLAGTVAIGLTGQFNIYNEKGLLSGPFSALLLLGAVEAALLTLIALDWKVWQPGRIARGKQIETWFHSKVLHSDASGENWLSASGKFRGRDVSIQRTPASGVTAWRWSVKTSATLQFHLARLDLAEERRRKSLPPAKDDSNLKTDDAEFEERYDWQSAQPNEVLALLKQEDTRAALKRLASLFAQHGKIESEHNGLVVSGGSISLLQCPAPAFQQTAYFSDELLLVLHDLTRVADALEGAASVKAQTPAPPAAAEQDDSLSAWLALGCAGALAIVIWMGFTYFLSRASGLPAAMIGFFVPPVALALWFVVLSGRSTHPETESAIRREAKRIIGENPDLAGLRFSADK